MAFCRQAAPQCRNTGELLERFRQEFGKRTQHESIIQNHAMRYDAGQPQPKVFSDIFAALGSAIPPEPPKKPVSAPATTSPAAASVATGASANRSQSAPDNSLESIGLAVIKTTTHPDPAVREPAQSALMTIDAAARLMSRADFATLSAQDKMAFMKSGGRLTAKRAEANTSRTDIEPGAKATLASNPPAGSRPDFSFLPTGQQKMQIIEEFDENGGLSESNWFTWFSERQNYCRKNGITPEMANGSPEAVIPAFVIETVAQASARIRMWADGDQSFLRSISSIQSEITRVKARPDYREKTADLDRLQRALRNARENFASYQAKRAQAYKDDLAETKERFEAKRKALF
jgi:hypothetical protein